MNSEEKELEMYKVAFSAFNNFFETYGRCNLYVYSSLNDPCPIYYENIEYNHNNIGIMFNCSKVREISSGLSNTYYCMISNDTFMMCDSMERIEDHI